MNPVYLARVVLFLIDVNKLYQIWAKSIVTAYACSFHLRMNNQIYRVVMDEGGLWKGVGCGKITLR